MHFCAFFSCKHLLFKEREEMPFFGRSVQGKWLLSVQGQFQQDRGDGKSTSGNGSGVQGGRWHLGLAHRVRIPQGQEKELEEAWMGAELAKEELGLHSLQPWPKAALPLQVKLFLNIMLTLPIWLN